MLFISHYIDWIFVEPYYTQTSASLWGGCIEWLFDGGKKIINFVYIYFISMYNNYWFIYDLFVLAWDKEEPKQEDEQACEEDPIISLHMMTKNL